MYSLTPGEWYLRYRCDKCKTRQVLFPDLSRGTARINAEYIVNCPACGHKTAYDSDDVERYQHPMVMTKAS